jgi:cell division transport system permease protein
MSGSYDNPGGPRRPNQQPVYAPKPAAQPLVPSPRPSQYTAPSSMPPPPPPETYYGGSYGPDYAEFYAEEHPTARSGVSLDGVAPPQLEQRELVAPVREDTSLELRQSPIVPAGSVMGRSLTLVVAIMCFLACLTAGTVYMINQSAAAWLRDVASEVTVQIEPRERLDMEKTVREVADFLGRQPGVVAAKPMSVEDSALLLEPWLGGSEGLKSLPMPRLVAVEVDRDQPPDLGVLKVLVNKQFPAATLDDHRQWQQQIRAVTRSFALGGIAILLLVAAATTAIIISATRSAMASNREIVEVLHYVGATDRLIAREFERHFLRLGIKAGMIGAVCASAVFFGMPPLMQWLGGGSVTQAEMSRLFGSGALDLKGYLVLAGLVVVISALCMLTSRFSVKRILQSQQ